MYLGKFIWEYSTYPSQKGMYFDQMREKSEDLNRFKNRKKKKTPEKKM